MPREMRLDNIGMHRSSIAAEKSRLVRYEGATSERRIESEIPQPKLFGGYNSKVALAVSSSVAAA